MLAAQGLRREIAVTVPTFAAAAVVAASTDLVTGMPRRLADALARIAPLAVVEPPVPAMVFRMQLVWHERTHLDEGARCFREVVIAALREPPRRRSEEGRNQKRSSIKKTGRGRERSSRAS